MDKTGVCWLMRLSLTFCYSCCLWQSSPAQEAMLARTPPMGWNSWYGIGSKVSDAILRAQVDAMVRNGMRDLGYVYVNIDGGWEGQRDVHGVIHPNSNFPDMKALADYIHSKGFKFGIYSSPGPKTCDQLEGSWAHEDQDAQTYAAWGVDFLKYDWCNADVVYQGPGSPQAASKKMHDALVRTGRPILFSLCIGLELPWRWGPSVGASMWRTAPDIGDANSDRTTLVGFQQAGLERFAGPGRWNDPDMLMVGLGKLDVNENRMQMSLWCLLAAPLLASADLTKISSADLAILTNPEVIAIDQDPAGVQGYRVFEEGPLEVWVKPLADGSKAVGLFNHDERATPVTASFKEVGIRESASVRDLWARKTLGVFKDSFTAEVPTNGAVLLRMTPDPGKFRGE